MASDQNQLTEVVVFMVHALKRMSYAFQRLDEVADATDGSPMKAFYLDGIYNYASAFFLLDKGDDVSGGSFSKALAPAGLSGLLEPMIEILNSEMGGTTFGELIRVFRNKALVHTTYQNSDLHRIYADVDMFDPIIQSMFQDNLIRLRDAGMGLAFELAEAAGIAPGDLGLKQ